jgi:nicotinate phosphoribosyltransferase
MYTPLTIDLYQLSMGAGYVNCGIADKKAVFELFVRKLPEHRDYLVMAGLQKALDYLETLSFCEREIDAVLNIPQLRTVGMSERFVDYLRDFAFNADVWAMPEGTIFYGNEPVMRVEGTLFECQLVETALLSIINPASMVASKASRMRDSAPDGVKLYEFGSRRTGLEEAVDSARAAFIGGFDGTSNVEAYRRWDIPIVGTMAHSWVLSHETEEEAFRNFLNVYLNGVTLLVDTYDPIAGLDAAIEIAGERLRGVRIDSGDIVAFSKYARARLDEARLPLATIMASGDLDEYSIREFARQGAPIDAYGIGSNLVRSVDSPKLGGVYKLVELDGRPVAKFSKDKATLPGAKQVYRFPGHGDYLALANEDIHLGGLAEPLLQKVMARGRRCWTDTEQDARARRNAGRAAMDAGFTQHLTLSDGLERALAAVVRSRT